MKRGTAGTYKTVSTAGGESCKAFVPDILPPDPPIQKDDQIQDAIDQAHLSLGRLDSITTLLPDTALFIYMYIRKEAVLSSQIEGTQASLSDLLSSETDEAPGVPLDDIKEVSNYVAAMSHGIDRLRGGFPISLRLIREIHEVLLSKGRGSDRAPGEFRTSQNWIGGTRPGNAVFVPPPPEDAVEAMGLLEKFLHNDPVRTPPLIKAALVHAQFETIHPFLDGNGRVGRLLITLILCAEKLLSEPMLYLSLYFKTNRQRYYDLLQAVRTDGDWESWLLFFLEGVRETASAAVATAKTLTNLFAADQQLIETLGRSAGSALRLHGVLQRHPVISIARAAEELKLSIPTVTACMERLIVLEIVRELTGKGKNRRFGYSRYIQILAEGTEPL